MIEYVYMIRNGDLYNIGRTDNLSLIKNQLQPGVLIASLKTEDAKEILEILQRNYSNQRVPQSNYFRLTKSQYKECKQKLNTAESKEDFKAFFSGINLVLTLLSFGLYFLLV